MSKGFFVVLDGTDGLEKASQATLLDHRLSKEGYPVFKIDFPRYYDNLFGHLIGECLAGEHGDFPNLDPYIASVLYAADRFETSPAIREQLSKGTIVIADRYVSSNQMHQGGKIQDEQKRKDFLHWLDYMEFEVFRIPRPDCVLYLDVPVPVTLKLLEDNKDELIKKKKYLRRRQDIVESDQEYLENSRRAASKIIEERNVWKRIDCCDIRGELLPKEEIHEKIYKTVFPLLF